MSILFIYLHNKINSWLNDNMFLFQAENDVIGIISEKNRLTTKLSENNPKILYNSSIEVVHFRTHRN